MSGPMTGPEFYQAAAKDLDYAEANIGDCTPGESAIALAMIGVGRATLALTAATLYPYCDHDKAEAEYQEWLKAMRPS